MFTRGQQQPDIVAILEAIRGYGVHITGGRSVGGWLSGWQVGRWLEAVPARV